MTDEIDASRPQYPTYPGEGEAATPTPSATPAVPRFPESVDGLVVFAGLAALAYALLDVAQAVLAYPASQDYLDGADQGLEAQDIITAYDVVGGISFPVVIIAYVATCLLLYRSRTNDDLVRPSRHHARARGWAWGSWIVPFVSLVFPYQYVRDLLRRSSDTSAPPVVGWWWGVFLTATILDRIFVSIAPGFGPIDRDAASSLPGLETFGAVVMVVACALWLSVLSLLRRDQRDLIASAV